jgi:hypothetical protein
MHTWAKGKNPKPAKCCFECNKDGGQCRKTTQKCARCWWMATPCRPASGISVGEAATRIMQSVLNDPRPRGATSQAGSSSAPIPEGARVVRIGEMSASDITQPVQIQAHGVCRNAAAADDRPGWTPLPPSLPSSAATSERTRPPTSR